MLIELWCICLSFSLPFCLQKSYVYKMLFESLFIIFPSMTDAFNSMNVCIFISEMMQLGHWPPFSLYDVEIIFLCRYLFSLYWYGPSVFWCSIKTVCYRSLAVIYFRRSKSNVRHIDFWSSYLVCMHLNNVILGYFYSAHFSQTIFNSFRTSVHFQKTYMQSDRLCYLCTLSWKLVSLSVSKLNILKWIIHLFY